MFVKHNICNQEYLTVRLLQGIIKHVDNVANVFLLMDQRVACFDITWQRLNFNACTWSLNVSTTSIRIKQHDANIAKDSWLPSYILAYYSKETQLQLIKGVEHGRSFTSNKYNSYLNAVCVGYFEHI